MGIRFRCHHCEHELNLKEFQAGRRARCPVCSGRFRVPTTSCDFSTPLEDDEQELAPAAVRADQPGAGQPGAGQREAGRSQASPPFELKQPTADLERFKRTQPDAQPSEKPARVSKKQALAKTGTSKAATAKTATAKAAANEVAEQAPALNAVAAATAAGAGTPEAAPQEAAAPSAPAARSPDVPRAIAEAPQAVWYVRPPSGGQFGPADSTTFYQWMKENRVAREALVWRDGWPQWMIAGDAFEEYYGSRWLLPDAPAAAAQPAESLAGEIPASAAATVNTGSADNAVGAGVAEAATVGGTRVAEPASSDAPAAGTGLAGGLGTGGLGTGAPGTPAPAGTPGAVRPIARRKRRKTNYTLWITVLAVVAIALVVVLVAVLMSQ